MRSSQWASGRKGPFTPSESGGTISLTITITQYEKHTDCSVPFTFAFAQCKCSLITMGVILLLFVYARRIPNYVRACHDS